jgi:D-aminopeptidase
MRVLVSVDMEGIAGVVDRDDISPGHGEYERNRTLLTAEASAAVRGVHAYEADAQVLVTEAHAAFRNLLPELLDRRAELLRGDPKPDGMMAGLAPDVDAVVFIGYHGKAGTARSVMSHTISGGVIADVRCDGRSLGELGLNTALARTAACLQCRSRAMTPLPRRRPTWHRACMRWWSSGHLVPGRLRCCILMRHASGSRQRYRRRWPAGRRSGRCASTDRYCWKSRCSGRI